MLKTTSEKAVDIKLILLYLLHLELIILIPILTINYYAYMHKYNHF